MIKMEMETPRPATGAGSPAAAPSEDKPNGPAVAATLAAGIGTLVLGILTTLSEASEGVADFLNWSDRVGPLSGKTSLAVIAFLLSWGGIHMALREREVEWRPVITTTIVMVAIALLLTFPPFFQLFKSD
jgi:hypothetical protein